MKRAAVIVAAGRGMRAGGGLPKQWRDLAGLCVAARTWRALSGHPSIDLCLLVIHPDDAPHADALGARWVAGGADRAASVRAGLEALVAEAPDQVLIHDVARPFVSAAVIDGVIAALDHGPAAAPGLPLADALWRAQGGTVQAAVSRDHLHRAQTPQGFHFAPILAAHRAHTGAAADDVEVARAAALPVTITQGDEANFKLTTQGDFDRARALLKGSNMRLGNGYDVHRFGAGDHVTLCGVAVPHDRGLVGHSDADVGMHALTDALYGALAEGDIGQHFPPSDPQWKGAASDIFLRHAMARVRARGLELANADVTLICEQPKIGPHAAQMRQVLANIMEVSMDQVSVKATTSEKLGFTGRAEGIAAQATALVVSA